MPDVLVERSAERPHQHDWRLGSVVLALTCVLAVWFAYRVRQRVVEDIRTVQSASSLANAGRSARAWFAANDAPVLPSIAALGDPELPDRTLRRAWREASDRAQSRTAPSAPWIRIGMLWLCAERQAYSADAGPLIVGAVLNSDYFGGQSILFGHGGVWPSSALDWQTFGERDAAERQRLNLAPLPSELVDEIKSRPVPRMTHSPGAARRELWRTVMELGIISVVVYVPFQVYFIWRRHRMNHVFGTVRRHPTES